MHGGRGVTKIRDVKIRRRHGASALLLFQKTTLHLFSRLNNHSSLLHLHCPPYPFIYFWLIR